MTLKECKDLLAMNTQLMWQELATGSHATIGRLLDLTLHRSIVKDMIIENLEKELEERRNLETRPFQDKKEVA